MITETPITTPILAYPSDTYGQTGDLDEVQLKEVNHARSFYPELAHWTDFAFLDAWTQFSHEIYMVWWYESDCRIRRFLQFLVFLQTEKEWHKGMPEELDELPLPDIGFGPKDDNVHQP